MKVITNPKEKHIKVKTTSVLVSSKKYNKYESNQDDHPTLMIKLFDVNNPHKIPNIFPHTVYEFSNIEKVRIRRLNVSYYLDGEHIVINDIEELYIIHEDNKIVLKAYQFELEHRASATMPKAKKDKINPKNNLLK
jgi:hypothetical protein